MRIKKANKQNPVFIIIIGECSFLLLEHRMQPIPNLLCGLASWPLFEACSMFLGD